MQNFNDKEIQFPKSYNYRPLLFGLFIAKSKIEGQGLFTNINIKKNIDLGVSHIKFKNELIRLPLGGFVNHSYTPNCKLVILEELHYEFQNFYLISTQDIKQNEELTLNYIDSAKLTKIPWHE